MTTRIIYVIAEPDGSEHRVGVVRYSLTNWYATQESHRAWGVHVIRALPLHIDLLRATPRLAALAAALHLGIEAAHITETDEVQL